MKLKDALELSFTIPHSYVKSGKNSGWSEYFIQYFWKDGELYWTAGMTVGGKVSPPLEDTDRWFVFMDWGRDNSIVEV